MNEYEFNCFEDKQIQMEQKFNKLQNLKSANINSPKNIKEKDAQTSINNYQNLSDYSADQKESLLHTKKIIKQYPQQINSLRAEKQQQYEITLNQPQKPNNQIIKSPIIFIPPQNYKNEKNLQSGKYQNFVVKYKYQQNSSESASTKQNNQLIPFSILEQLNQKIGNSQKIHAENFTEMIRLKLEERKQTNSIPNEKIRENMFQSEIDKNNQKRQGKRDKNKANFIVKLNVVQPYQYTLFHEQYQQASLQQQLELEKQFLQNQTQSQVSGSQISTIIKEQFISKEENLNEVPEKMSPIAQKQYKVLNQKSNSPQQQFIKSHNLNKKMAKKKDFYFSLNEKMNIDMKKYAQINQFDQCDNQFCFCKLLTINQMTANGQRIDSNYKNHINQFYNQEKEKIFKSRNQKLLNNYEDLVNFNNSLPKQDELNKNNNQEQLNRSQIKNKQKYQQADNGQFIPYNYQAYARYSKLKFQQQKDLNQKNQLQQGNKGGGILLEEIQKSIENKQKQIKGLSLNQIELVKQFSTCLKQIEQKQQSNSNDKNEKETLSKNNMIQLQPPMLEDAQQQQQQLQFFQKKPQIPKQQSLSPEAQSKKKITELNSLKQPAWDKNSKNFDVQLVWKFKQYIDFLQKINFSNNQIMKIPRNTTQIYKVYIGKGNNGFIIKNVFKSRWWWQVVEKRPSDNVLMEKTNGNQLNLLWTQIKNNAYLSTLKQYKENNSTKKEQSNETQKSTSLNDSSGFGDQQTDNINEDEQKRINSAKADLSKSSSINYSIQKLKPKGQKFIKEFSQSVNLTFDNVLEQESSNYQINKQILKRNKRKSRSTYKTKFSNESLDQLRKIFNEEDAKLICQSKIAQNSIFFIHLTQCKQANSQKNFQQTDQQRNLVKSLTQQPFQYTGDLQRIKSNVILKEFQSDATIRMHNHLNDHYHLSNKKALYYNMKFYCELTQQNVFDYLPVTFHIQIKPQDDSQFAQFIDYYNSQQKLVNDQNNSEKNMWIVKPGEITNRGKGITLCTDLNQVKQVVQSQEFHPNGKKKTYIIQKYIDKPLLYQKRKFDIRTYYLLTSINGILKVYQNVLGYWYQEGYIRTSSQFFTLKNTSKNIHLTNDAIQNKYDEYGKYESGNKVSYQDFARYMEKQSEVKCNFYIDILPKMRQYAITTIKSVYLNIDPTKIENSFELFGLDFMIDINLKVYLIEVNTNPCLELSCPLLARLIPNVLDNLLKIVVDPLFPPPEINQWNSSKKLNQLPENIEESNKFELIFDELVDGPPLKKFFSKNYYNRKELKQHIYEIEEEEEECNDKEDSSIEDIQ